MLPLASAGRVMAADAAESILRPAIAVARAARQVTSRKSAQRAGRRLGARRASPALPSGRKVAKRPMPSVARRSLWFFILCISLPKTLYPLDSPSFSTVFLSTHFLPLSYSLFSSSSSSLYPKLFTPSTHRLFPLSFFPLYFLSSPTSSFPLLLSSFIPRLDISCPTSSFLLFSYISFFLLTSTLFIPLLSSPLFFLTLSPTIVFFLLTFRNPFRTIYVINYCQRIHRLFARYCAKRGLDTRCPINRM